MNDQPPGYRRLLRNLRTWQHNRRLINKLRGHDMSTTGDADTTPDVITEKQLPRYQCHKKVWALKIKYVTYDDHLVFEDDGYAPINPGLEYIAKHNPQPGGYYVVYEDGYRSYSPGDVFEKGYTRI